MQSKAQATWEGDLMSGKGRVSSRTSGVLRDAGLSWKSRTETAGGNTTPEELLAAAHASCFAMALSNGLQGGKAGAEARGWRDGHVRAEAGRRIRSAGKRDRGARHRVGNGRGG